MNDILFPLMMWVVDQNVISRLGQYIQAWYAWRMSKIYIPEGQEKNYKDREQTINTIFRGK